MVLPSGQKLTLGLPATSTLDPRRSLLPLVCTIPSASAISEMHSGSRVLWWCLAPPVILPRSPELYQNGVISILFQTRKQKSRVGEWDSHVVFCTLSWYNSRFFCHWSSGWSRLLRCALNRTCHSDSCVRLVLSPRNQNACLIVAKFSIPPPRFAQNLTYSCC
jgi:hypothetical protein